MSGGRTRLALAVALYVLAGLALGARLGTWTDEEYTLATTAHGVAYAVQHAVGYELQAPLYFAVLALWREANGSVWFARLFSVLCGAATLVAFAALGRRIAPRTDPLPFALLAALNPFAVWAALEIRHYGLALLLTALMWLAFDRGFAGEPRRGARAAFVTLAIAGIYVQYFAAFILVGFAATLIVLRKGAALGAYVACGALVAVAVVPLALLAHGGGNWFAAEAPPLGHVVRATLLHPWLDFVLPYDRGWDAFPFVRWSYFAVSLVAAAAALLCRPAWTRRTAAIVAGAVAVEVVYVVLAALLRMELSERYFVALYVPVAAAAYALWAALGAGRVPAGRSAFAATAALTACVLFSHYRHLAQPGDWVRVADFLERNAKPPDAILIYPPDAEPALRRQYRGMVAVVPYPRPLAPEHYTIAGVSVTSFAQARDSFAGAAAGSRIWFVENGPCEPRNPKYGCEYVRRAIAADFEIRSSHGFYGSRVEELAPRNRKRSAAGTSS